MRNDIRLHGNLGVAIQFELVAREIGPSRGETRIERRIERRFERGDLKVDSREAIRDEIRGSKRQFATDELKK